jgi:hypothetical protein
MIITNKHNVPNTIVNVVKANLQKPSRDVMRASEIKNNPIVKDLTIKHWDEISQDVTDFMWSMLGTAMHNILEVGADEKAITEKRLEFRNANFPIPLTGKPDLYQNNGIEDWKITSVFSFMLGDKPEWETQLNIYKFLYEHHNYRVDTLTINAILRDWMRGKAKFDMTYPQIPFLRTSMKIWESMDTYNYIKDRYLVYASPFKECTPEEKWERPTTYAVTKKGNKRATRVFNAVELAEDYIDNMKDEKEKDKKVKAEMIIDERKGECVKCESYCLVRDFCPWNKIRKEKENEKI